MKIGLEIAIEAHRASAVRVTQAPKVPPPTVLPVYEAPKQTFTRARSGKYGGSGKAQTVPYRLNKEQRDYMAFITAVQECSTRDVADHFGHAVDAASSRLMLLARRGLIENEISSGLGRHAAWKAVQS